ncbi:hypothetical protein [Actinomadura sp. 7K507]|uniref:hypothetical protein n=1 Tax=Actinomadura sp. 7K507 TaxID=2530365 RepID=UPI0010464D52|nr:hypothetical protein [Actinomadura sp. 7K507]TDC81157.1 hypothetical protein E1285_33235 [Actinomadura sp. 7K507]
MREDQGVPDDGVLTAPLKVPGDGPGDGGPAKAAVNPDTVVAVDPAPVRAFGQDVDRLAELVERLSSAAAVLGDRLDGEVRGVLGDAEKALAEARAARQETADANERTRQAEARADLAVQEAADAREELEEGLAAAKVSVTAAQESEANAWKEAGAHQQARATSGNEAANAEGLRKRAEAAWSSEHQARNDAEKERDDLATRLAAEQAALVTARGELTDARTELAEVRTRLEAAVDTERQLRAEMSAAQGEIAGLTVERDSVAERAAEMATRADRAEQRAEAADSRIDTERERADLAVQRADVAVQRADAAEDRINRDAATVRALQDTLRSALDLPSVEDLDGGKGVPVGDSGTVAARPDGSIVVEKLPDVLDGELAARFARALLAVRVHQATRRSVQDGDSDGTDGEANGTVII